MQKTKARAHSAISEAVRQRPNEFHAKLITEAESARRGFYLLMRSPLLHDPSVGKAGPNTLPPKPLPPTPPALWSVCGQLSTPNPVAKRRMCAGTFHFSRSLINATEARRAQVFRSS